MVGSFTKGEGERIQEHTAVVLPWGRGRREEGGGRLGYSGVENF